MTTIRIVTPDSSTFLVDYQPHHTLQSVREKLALLHKLPTQQAAFFCNGKAVPDGVKLQSIGITPQHVLQAAPAQGLRINVTPTFSQQQQMIAAGGVVQPQSPFGAPVSPQLQIQTSYPANASPQHSPSLQQQQPRSPYAAQHLSAGQSPNRPSNATHGRTRSGSMSTSGYALGTPPVHPSQPNSAREHARRSSLSLPPSSGPSPFDVVEQQLAKVASHPIASQLYEKGPSQPSTPTSFSSTQPLPASTSPSTATTATSDIPAHSPLGRSQSGTSLSPRPQVSPGSQPASPRTPIVDTAPSTSSFQPVLSFQSKLTALSLALQDVVDERNKLDKKTDEEKQRVAAIITDKKRDVEQFLWEHQKHAAAKQGEVMEEERRLRKLEDEVDRAKRTHDERMRELDEKAAERRNEMAAMQQRMAADEEQRTRAVESARSAIGELMSVKDELSFDKQKAEERVVRQMVDLLLKAGVDMQVLRREVDSSGR